MSLKSLLSPLRASLLHRVNRSRFRAVAARLRGQDRLPVFVIASPPDMHLAPLAVQSSSPAIRHIIVANGLPDADIQWLRGLMPGLPVVGLRASLRGNNRTFLSHAEVVRQCALASSGDFAIQDADCFVLDSAWWDQLHFDNPETRYAAGPFGKPLRDLGVLMPDTYLVLIDGKSFWKREKEGIAPDIGRVPVPALRALLEVRGITGKYSPEAGKDYYDTLQMHWTAAALQGRTFQELPGADETVVHVGGSTYLNNRPCDDVSHWDYWPLNTPYFHMRVMEFPRFAFVRPRFEGIYKRYGSADKILADYPGFRNSGRYELSERMLAHYRPFLEAA